MIIDSFQHDPIGSISFLNAGKRPKEFFVDQVPVYLLRCHSLPDSLDAVVATADLQGREMSANRKSSIDGLKLLGEVMPELLETYFESLKVCRTRVGAVLAEDFYSYPDLRGRVGTGDVTPVWQAFSNAFRWVVGVGGNHDTFGERGAFNNSNSYFLDGDRVELDTLRVAGLSGIIGNPKRNFRRTHESFLETLGGARFANRPNRYA